MRTRNRKSAGNWETVEWKLGHIQADVWGSAMYLSCAISPWWISPTHEAWPVWAVNERMRSLRPEWGPSEKRLGSALLNEELRHPQGIWSRAAASWCLREQVELVSVSDLDAWEMPSSSGLLGTSIWMNDQESLVHWCILVILKSLQGRAGK